MGGVFVDVHVGREWGSGVVASLLQTRKQVSEYLVGKLAPLTLPAAQHVALLPEFARALVVAATTANVVVGVVREPASRSRGRNVDGQRHVQMSTNDYRMRMCIVSL